MEPKELLEEIWTAVRDEPNKALALYVHIPFCATKCHFCDWVVDIPVARLRSGQNVRQAHTEALCRQIRFFGPQLTRMGYTPAVMYWGGGTPTRLDPAEMVQIATALAESFDLATMEQWSMETTPNDLTAEKLETMLELGVDRISVGVQSFNPEQLRRAARSHDAEGAAAAIELLQRAGVENFNIDLISGFPGEDLESFRRTIDRTIELAPPHVSVYPYRATPQTVMAMQLHRHHPDWLSELQMLEAYELSMELLAEAGYFEYGHGYWIRDAAHVDHDGTYKYALLGDKIGFGSGAESIMGHFLLVNESKAYARYLTEPLGFSTTERYSLSRPESFTPLIGGALMTPEGLVFSRFERLTGIPFAAARQTPFISGWLAYFERCGARFVETDTSLSIDRSVVHKAYITHLVESTRGELASAFHARGMRTSREAESEWRAHAGTA